MEKLILAVASVILMVGVGFIFWVSQDHSGLEVFRVIIQWLGLCFGGLALSIGWLNYSRKLGSDFSAHYVLQEYTGSTKKDVAMVWITNHKDKTEVIYQVYLKVKDKYILLVDLKDNPLLVSAYSTEKLEILDTQSMEVATYQDAQSGSRSLGDEYKMDGSHDIYLNNAAPHLIPTKKIKNISGLDINKVIQIRRYPTDQPDRLDAIMDAELVGFDTSTNSYDRVKIQQDNIDQGAFDLEDHLKKLNLRDQK